ncbi:hypothetical protein [Manganibacter manganicus]|nr:hypothetical protein [Pseudaminobacter manganicus]
MSNEIEPLEAPANPPAPTHQIFVSYVTGSGKFLSEVIQAPFEDIDSAEK